MCLYHCRTNWCKRNIGTIRLIWRSIGAPAYFWPISIKSETHQTPTTNATWWNWRTSLWSSFSEIQWFSQKNPSGLDSTRMATFTQPRHCRRVDSTKTTCWAWKKWISKASCTSCLWTRIIFGFPTLSSRWLSKSLSFDQCPVLVPPVVVEFMRPNARYWASCDNQKHLSNVHVESCACNTKLPLG